MIVAEMRARHVPVEILGLEVERIDVGQQNVERAGEFLGGVGAEICRGGESGGTAGLYLFGPRLVCLGGGACWAISARFVAGGNPGPRRGPPVFLVHANRRGSRPPRGP